MKRKRLLYAALAAAMCATACEAEVVQLGTQDCMGCDEKTCCNGRCVDLETDAEACGECSNVCGPGQQCVNSECETPTDACGGCKDGLSCCGTTCVDLTANQSNCGACGVECPSDMICAGGFCDDAEPAACDDSCVSPRTCCGDGDEQKCANTDFDRNNCGSCGNVCPEGQACQNGKCAGESGGSCENGCGSGSCCDGACADIMTDAMHCGSCDNACADNLFCQKGECVPACSCAAGMVCDAQGSCVESCGGAACGKDEICCNDKCVDKNAASSCGTCDNVCSGETSVCNDGACVAQCSEGKELCGTSCIDTQTDNDNCGACGTKCKSGTVCKDGACSCKPKTCAELKYTCGTTDDGCGNQLNCGDCVEGETCTNNVCGCKATTCAAQGKNCGSIGDGCGGTLNCGSCSSGQECKDNVCGCQPKTCAGLGKNCGSVSDGCGGTLNCGSCSTNQECKDNVCTAKACTPTTCAAQGKNCGSIGDGCGGTLNCGTCSSGSTCTSNVCKCTPTTCAAKGKNCGSISDGCGGTLSCGSCGSGYACTNNVCVSTVDPYPTRTSIKGIQPDFQDPNQIIGNGGAGVAMNMVWMNWQSTKKSSCSGGEVLYDGYCFTVDANTVNHIKTYSDAGLVVTAVVYGPPAWARRSCTGVVADYFCAPTESGAVDYGRFAGFLANYFNGRNGHGRIADFVIHNEVNASEWFNYGCTKGTCNTDTWTTVYAQSWNNAYDYVKKEQPNAKVLISFEHHFGTTFDSMLSNARPVVSAETFLGKLIPKLGSRDWRIAWHSYPPDLTKPSFSANDWPRITFGNIGVLAGWLRKNYPSDPHAWEIQLTENGINGNGSSMRTTQASQLCQAFRNINGTPGIESFIYHRLVDHPTEVAAGLALGLWGTGGASDTKPAWAVWAYANRNVAAGYPSCGFEDLPYIRIRRGLNSSNSMHWVTSRQFPSGFKEESSYRILRDAAANTKVIYECRVGGATGAHTMPSPDANCEGQFNMGPLGYIYTTQVSGSQALYRCYVKKTGSHFISTSSNCEGQTTESLIGYVLP